MKLRRKIGSVSKQDLITSVFQREWRHTSHFYESCGARRPESPRVHVMTGGAFFPTAGAGGADEEYELDEAGGGMERHAVQWVGKPGVKGPKFAKLPLLTVGMLGIQVGGARLHVQKGTGRRLYASPQPSSLSASIRSRVELRADCHILQCVWSIEMGYGQSIPNDPPLPAIACLPQPHPISSTLAFPSPGCPSSSWPGPSLVCSYSPSLESSPIAPAPVSVVDDHSCLWAAQSALQP